MIAKGLECIAEGTWFSECTREQLEWAKQYDKDGTEYYIKIWSTPLEHSLELSNPMWRNNRWEDMVW